MREGVNGLLDIARRTYTETMESIYELGERYREEHSLSTLRVVFHRRRGWYLQVSPSDGSLPECFTQVTRERTRTSCSSHELCELSQRNTEAYTEIVLVTGRCA